MKKGAILINAARGSIVDVHALAEAMKSNHLGGAMIDVHPTEPKSTTEPFVSELQGLENVILTPHIGGSTQEAQEGIGQEVAESLLAYSNTGSTIGAVNFVQANLPPHPGKHRILHIHKNRPGVLAAINDVLLQTQINVAGQYLATDQDIGYVVIDIDQDEANTVFPRLKDIPDTIRSRILY
jgi:D-3-phosphoglycerate dehydrogenase